MINNFILCHIRFIETTGVIMRIFSFSLVSWLGPGSPFLFVWTCNTADEVVLSWCALLKKNAAYSLQNIFRIMAGIAGVLRTLDILHFGLSR